MVSIIHRIGIKASIDKVYAAIATTEGVAGWWTRETTDVSETGNRIQVRFESPDATLLGSMEIEVIKLTPNKRVRWSFRSGPEEWIGTEVTFDLKQEGDFTIVNFSHSRWREAIEFTAHCSMK